MSDKDLQWDELEDFVRLITQIKFGAPARAEDIAGVRCDCVAHLDDGSVVLAEVSRQRTLTKLREDLTKFNVLRPHFIGQNVLPKCFFICGEPPTASLIESGRANHVNVYSVLQFFNAMLGVSDYVHARNRVPFGSAVNMYSGEPDQSRYVSVSYFANNGDTYTTDRIAHELAHGRTIVLIGDYGSGKSRCVKEVFELLTNFATYRVLTPFAINLRENWGLKRAPEIITRHLTDLGLGDRVGDALKLAYSDATVYLLDGFDEIGAQTWSDDPTRLVEIRRQSLMGVKELIGKARSGILIAGREHYFNDDAELITSLGLGNKQPLILRCDQELTPEQFAEMVGHRIPVLPAWMPKTPLIATIVREIEPPAFEHMAKNSTGQIDLWSLLIETFCDREARINPILDADIIRLLYTHIGRLARTTSTPVGPISIRQINDAFERTTGRPPTDESAIILQRLPGLSRIGAESLDRQFVDMYILDGLKAEDVLAIYQQQSTGDLGLAWRHPIGEFGAQFVAARLTGTRQLRGVAAFLKRFNDSNNLVLLSDLVAALFVADADTIDLEQLILEGGVFSDVSLGDTAVENVTLSECYFESLDITDADPKGIAIRGAVIFNLSGVTSATHLPPWVQNCEIERFQSVSTLAAIRESDLTLAQTFLLSSMRKLFLQPGSGRKESSMYKGYGDVESKRICERVIALLVRERFCEKHQGSTGALYIPNRRMTGRVKTIMSMLTTSKDDLWIKASDIRG